MDFRKLPKVISLKYLENLVRKQEEKEKKQTLKMKYVEPKKDKYGFLDDLFMVE